MINHYINGKFVKLTHLESAKQSHKEGFNVVWDIGLEYNELESEVRNFYKNNGYSVFKDKRKSTKFTFMKKDHNV